MLKPFGVETLLSPNHNKNHKHWISTIHSHRGITT